MPFFFIGFRMQREKVEHLERTEDTETASPPNRDSNPRTFFFYKIFQ